MKHFNTDTFFIMQNYENAAWAPALLPGLSKLSDGHTTYAKFRSTLITNYSRVQLGILLTWLGIFLALAVLFAVQGSGALLLMPLIVVFISLCEHRLLNVIHEGAHYLIAQNRKHNDAFTNVVAGSFFLVDVDQYRITHIRHHKDLGGPNDPENAHMDKLDFTWLVAAFSGFGAISRLLTRKKFRDQLAFQKEVSHLIVPLIGVFLHATLLTAMFLFAPTSVLAAWILSTYFVTPGLGLLRNLLEHKFVEAVDSDIWVQLSGESKISENPTTNVTTRTFTGSLLSRLYGSMGFTRHLLHHWDPSISFTNLEKVHSFLLQTSIGPALGKTDTTFTATFRHLWRK